MFGSSAGHDGRIRVVPPAEIDHRGRSNRFVQWTRKATID